MNLWYPEARQSLKFVGAGTYVFGPYRGVLHHTEGDTIGGALATYPRTKAYPHFTVDEWVVEQHIPLNVAATALEHPSGTVDTNRASCIQIEIVGWTAKAAQMNDALCARLARLMRWIESQTGIQPNYVGGGSRMSTDAWKSFHGWCGHIHVPNNHHTDPGAIPTTKLFNVAPQVQTVISEREYIDVNAVAMKFEGVQLGPDGNGWKSTPIEVDRILGVIDFGSYPPEDGYWPIPTFGKQARNLRDDFKSVIEIRGGTPGQIISFEVWYVE